MQQYGYTTIAERHCKLDARKWHFSSPLSRDRAVTLRTKLSILYVYVPSAYSWSQNFKMHWEKWLYNQSFLHRSKRRNWNYCQEKLILPRFRQNSKESIWQLTTSCWLHLGQPMFSPLKHKPHPKKSHSPSLIFIPQLLAVGSENPCLWVFTGHLWDLKFHIHSGPIMLFFWGHP